MRDVIVMAVIAVFFALCVGYVRWCDHIIGPDPDELRDDDRDGRDGAAADRAGEADVRRRASAPRRSSRDRRRR